VRRLLALFLAVLLLAPAFCLTSQRRRILFGGNPLLRGLTFYAPLSSSLAPSRSAGSPTATFTRSSSGTYVDGTGTVQTATSGNARFDFAASGQTKAGVLVETQATNLALHSEGFDDAYWVKTHVTVTADQTAGPDGLVTADKILADATTNNHVTRTQTFSETSGSKYTESIFATAGTSNYAYLGN